MNLLLDTRVALWALSTPWELSQQVRARIEGAPRVCVSAASAWELAAKASVGRVRVAPGFRDAVLAAGFEELDVRFSHAEAAQAFAPGPPDAFDRMLAAQALVEELTLVTADPGLRALRVPLLIV